ncbi:MAG: hypothetical protein K6E93_00940 [Bacteroidales bacterium]|nr:hypothetical protein [Bacteroidales bacterium]
MKKVLSILMVALMGLALCTTVACNKDDDNTNNTENNGGGNNNGGNNNGNNNGGNNGGDNGGNNGGGDTTIVNDVWVDLGLPSGTKWKNANEVNAADTVYNFYTYAEAVAAFGNALPTDVQWEELKDNCQWTGNGSGYITATGRNGNSIVLPAEGYRNCDGFVNFVGSDGYYWSSTPYGSDYAWGLYFSSGRVYMSYSSRCYGYSVRLVQN